MANGETANPLKAIYAPAQAVDSNPLKAIYSAGTPTTPATDSNPLKAIYQAGAANPLDDSEDAAKPERYMSIDEGIREWSTPESRAKAAAIDDRLARLSAVPTQREGTLSHMARSALSAVGLPESISDTPSWAWRMLGQEPGKPWTWGKPSDIGRPITEPINEAIRKPSQESLVGAIPFVGPPVVEASRQFQSNDISGGAGTLAGVLGSVVVPGMMRRGGDVIPRSGAEVPRAVGKETTAPASVRPASEVRIAEPRPASVVEAEAHANTLGIPPEVTGRISQNAEALRPIVDPEKIQARSDVQGAIDQAANVLRTNPDPRMQQPLTFPEQQRLANELGMKPEDLLRTKPGQAFSAEQVVAANAMLEASRTQVMNTARLAATGDAAYQQRFLETLARHQEIQQTVTERVAAEAGRALGAFRNVPEEGTIQAAVDSLSRLDDAARLEAANGLAKIDPNDTRAIAKFTRDITPSTTGDKLYEAWMNGVLSGGTVFVKATSDVAMRTLGVFTRATSAGVDALRSALTGAEQERFAGEAKADVYGMMRGWSKAAAQFSDTFFHELGMEGGPLDTGYRTAAIRGLPGKIIRTPTRALEAITDAAKILNYSAEIHAQAYRAAMREGLSGDAAWQRVEQLAADPTREMKEAAGQYGKEQTFQQKLGPLGQWVMEGRNKVPGGKYLLPFIKTPANILKAAAEYSPAGLMKVAVQARTGELQGGALSDALARGSLGTALTGTVIYHALEGNITGAGPTNPNDRKRLEAAGWQPYSVKVGNRFISYRKIEPLGTVMGLAADVAEALKSQAPQYPTAGLTNSLLHKVRENAGNAEFIGSLMRLNQIFEGRYWRGLAGTVVPTGVANIAKATDRTVRAPSPYDSFPEQVGQQLESRIPGLTGNVPPVVAPRGQPLQRPASALGGFNPYPVSTGGPQLSAIESLIERQEQIRQMKATRRQLIRQRVAARGRQQ